jgi:hypothetical protein
MQVPASLVTAIVGVAAVAAGWWWLGSRPRLPPDPGLLLAQRCDAALMQLIRERYNCTEGQAQVIYRRYLDYELTASATTYQEGEDGVMRVYPSSVPAIDQCALEVGFRPAAPHE